MQNDIERLIADIDTLKNRGRKVVRLELLHDVLTSIISQSPQKDADLERLHFQLTHENNLAEWKDSRETERLLLNAVMTFGGNALRVITWMNGGAAVACLAYSGNRGDKSLLPAMLFFCYGLLAGGIAHAGAYFAQYNYAHGDQRPGDRFRNFSIFLVLLAYVMFLIGVLNGYYGLQRVT